MHMPSTDNHGVAPRVTIVAFSPIRQDGRVLRQVTALARDYDVAVVGYGTLGDLQLPRVKMYTAPDPLPFVRRNVLAVPKLMLGRLAPALGYEHWYWDRPDYRAAYQATLATQPDVIFANDWSALPLAARVARETSAKVVLDLHEYAPLQLSHRKAWMALISPMIEYFLRRHAGSVAEFITVNGSIADRYRSEFGFDCTVVMNAPESTSVPDFRATDPARVRLVHHGLPIPDRELEVMIEIIGLARAEYELHFMLVDRNRAYVNRLRHLAAAKAPGRVFFDAAVAPEKIVETIAAFDIGIFVLPPRSYNAQFALPNKLFEFISAGLAVCVGPSPEMARLVEQRRCGIVTPSFDPGACATALNALAPLTIDSLKRASIAARSDLNAASEMGRVRAIAARVLGG
jgi:glycosyltransferase involved in cell wall biosynthesis